MCFQDDLLIRQEGLETLTKDELRQAMRARGMKALYGDGCEDIMRQQMESWLDLHLSRGLPSSLLLLSRAFTITSGAQVWKAGSCAVVGAAPAMYALRALGLCYEKCWRWAQAASCSLHVRSADNEPYPTYFCVTIQLCMMSIVCCRRLASASVLSLTA